MGLLDNINAGYKPKENAEYGQKKKLIGDAVCQVTLEAIVGKKSGKSWYILKGEAIHTIPDPKGRETTVEPGDEISRLYDPEDAESMDEMADDLFTAGITFEKGDDEEATFSNAKAAADGKLIYFRTWAKDKPSDKLEEGKPTYWQNVKVLSVSKVTPENSQPQIQF